MDTPGSLSGYRSIWHAFDPAGVEERKSRRLKRRTFIYKGANASWHMDSKYLFLLK